MNRLLCLNRFINKYFNNLQITNEIVKFNKASRSFTTVISNNIINKPESMMIRRGEWRLFFNSNILMKEKPRGEKKKKGAKATKIDLREANEVMNCDKYISDMEKEIENLKNNFIQNLTVRSSTGAIEQIPVEFNGEEYLLQELVQIAYKPKMVVMNCINFPQAIPQVLEALNKSGLNLNPQQDGTKLFVPIPKVTKEHREGLAKNAKSIFIKSRDNIKDIRSRELKNLKKKASVDEDLLMRVQSQLELLCDQYVKKAEEILNTKQKELLKSE